MVAGTKRKERHLQKMKKESTINRRDAKITKKWTLGISERKKKIKRHNKERLAPKMETKVNTVLADYHFISWLVGENLISHTDTEEKHSTQSQHNSQWLSKQKGIDPHNLHAQPYTIQDLK